jgi:hypothetical protein
MAVHGPIFNRRNAAKTFGNIDLAENTGTGHPNPDP